MNLKQCEVESRVEFFKCDIQETLKSRKTIKKWAYILHDKDETAPHYHIYLNFGSSSVDTKYVAEWFGLQESCVNKVKGRSVDMLLYLTHGNDSQKNKYQYSPTEVIANFDFQAEIEESKVLGDFRIHSYAKQLEYIHSRPTSEQSRLYNDLTKRWKLHCQWLTLHPDRDIQVIFITGSGGTGKTYYAKKLLKSMDLDFCISSSNNDFMQDYLGQRAMILDDCRDKTFSSFEDCLKFLDNHTASSVQSRFTNKVFNGDYIVITSAMELHKWFRGKDANGNFYNLSNEDFIQFYRRISCYVVVTHEEVHQYSELDKFGKPKGLARVFKNELCEKKPEQKPKTDFGSLFAKICEEVETDVFEIGQMKIKTE